MTDRGVRIEIRRGFQIEIVLGVLATMLALRISFYLDPPPGERLSWLAAAACFGAATVGVWFAKEWARWAFALLAAVVAIGLARQVILILTGIAEGSVVGWIALTLLWGDVAVRMFRPRTRLRFAASREAITRARATHA